MWHLENEAEIFIAAERSLSNFFNKELIKLALLEIIMSWLELKSFSNIEDSLSLVIGSNIIYALPSEAHVLGEYQNKNTLLIERVTGSLYGVLRNDSVVNILEILNLYEGAKLLSLNNSMGDVYKHFLDLLEKFFDEDKFLNNTINEIQNCDNSQESDEIVIEKMTRVLVYVLKKLSITRQILLYYEKCYLESSYSKLTIFEAFYLLLYKRIFPDEHTSILKRIFVILENARTSLIKNESLFSILTFFRFLSVVAKNSKSIKKTALTFNITFDFNSEYLQSLNKYLMNLNLQNPEKISDIIKFETDLCNLVFGNPESECNKPLDQLTGMIERNFETYNLYAITMKLSIADSSIFDTKVINVINTIVMKVIIFRLLLSNSSNLNIVIQNSIVESNLKSLSILYKLFMLYEKSNKLELKKEYFKYMDGEIDISLKLNHNVTESILLKEFSIAVRRYFFQISQDSNRKIKTLKKYKGKDNNNRDEPNEILFKNIKKYDILIFSIYSCCLNLQDIIAKCFNKNIEFYRQLDVEFANFIALNNYEVITEFVKYIDSTLNEVLIYLSEGKYLISSEIFFKNCTLFDLNRFSSRVSTICFYFSKVLNPEMFGIFSTQYKLYLTKRLLNRTILFYSDIFWCRIFFELVMLLNLLQPLVELKNHLYPQNLWSNFSKLTSMPDNVSKLFHKDQKYVFTKDFNKDDLTNGIFIIFKMIYDLKNSYKMSELINQSPDESIFAPIILQSKQWPNFSIEKTIDTSESVDMRLGVNIVRKFRKFNNDYSKGVYGNINDEHKILNWEGSLSYLYLDFNLSNGTVLSIHTVFIIGRILLLFNETEKLKYSCIVKLIKETKDDSDNLIKRSLCSLQKAGLLLQIDDAGNSVSLELFNENNTFQINENYTNTEEYLDISLITSKMFSKYWNR